MLRCEVHLELLLDQMNLLLHGCDWLRPRERGQQGNCKRAKPRCSIATSR